MRRTGTGVRGRRFAALLATTAVAAGMSAGLALGVDSIREQQWHLDAMHAPEMWKTTTGAGLTVAVVDSGFKADAPDLEGQFLPGTDFSGLSGGVFSDPTGHGTGISAEIAGTGKGLGGKGAYGLAPGVKILPVKINTMADGITYVEQLSKGIIYAADHGAKVINLSQGIAADEVSAPSLDELKKSVNYANSHGSVVFASAGNSGNTSNRLEYPSALQGVVAMAAVDRDGKATAESEHGPQVALAAPGMDVYTACTASSGYCKTHGTSDSSALASASAALIWAAHPDWTNNQVLRVLINTASSPQERSDYVGYGAIRPRIALTNPGDPGPADVFPLKQAGASTPSSAASAPDGTAPSQAQSAPAGSSTSSQPAASSSSGGLGMGVIVGVGALVLLVVIVVIVAIVRRNRSATPPPAPMPQGPGQQSYPGGFPGQQAPQGGQPAYGQPPYGQQPPAPGGFPPPPAQGTQPGGGNNPYAR